MFGERLQIARKQAGLSLRALSDRLEGAVSAQAIGKYERGEMMPSSGILLRLTKALGVGLDFFASPVGARLREVDFRKHSGTNVRERAMVEAAVLQHVERYLLIEEILGLDSSHWTEPFPRKTVTTVEEGEALASRVRAEWNLGIDPIPNLTELLEEKGVKVLMLPLPDRVSGLTCMVERREGDAVPVIVVNQNHPVERRRLTLAHELAHRVLQAESKIEEKAATRFAGAFLMPRDHLLAEIGPSRRRFGFEELMVSKRMYRVSAAALIVRCRDTGIISSDQMTRVFMTIGRSWRREEPRPLEGRGQVFECPRRFERLCYRALAEELVSVTKAAELLGRPVTEIEAAMGGDAADGPDRYQ
jgi:Zn-dependent peptidase ImmA (M78 family)/transcriptional regulator with XRE-family HTH domain